MQAHGATFVRLEGLQIADSLGLEQCAKVVGRARDGPLSLRLVSELDEDAVICPTFVQLAGAVQVARPITNRRGTLGDVAQAALDGPQFFFQLRRRRQVSRMAK